MSLINWRGERYQQVAGPLSKTCKGCVFNSTRTRSDCVAFREKIAYTGSCLDEEDTIYILSSDLEVEFKSIDE